MEKLGVIWCFGVVTLDSLRVILIGLWVYRVAPRLGGGSAGAGRVGVLGVGFGFPGCCIRGGDPSPGDGSLLLHPAPLTLTFGNVQLKCAGM